MSIDTLFVVGNGFDVRHGIRSRYPDFRRFIEDTRADLSQVIAEYFDYEMIWADFEQALASFDSDLLLENVSHYFVSYAAEDWSDAYHHDYQYAIDEVVEALTTTLKKAFGEWLLELENQITLCSIDKNLTKLRCVNRDAFFINFNYTSTLQRCYDIPDKNVFHIHGKAGNDLKDIILGHAWAPSDRQSLSDIDGIEDQDVRITEGNALIDQYFACTYKPTAKIIDQNIALFDRLRSVKQIYVLGHSLSDVDLDYFKTIINVINVENSKWHVSYFDDRDLAHHSKVMHSLGVTGGVSNFSKLDSLI